jgi:lipopolysaccharide export system protein LptC
MAAPSLPLRVGLAVRETLSAYLPLLLMVVLALATWWLVKNSPKPLGDDGPAEARSEPDYAMSGFVLERFGADGRLKLRMEGAHMRHLPASDRIEIDEVRLHSIAPDGRVTLAQARQALANGDGSEVQLRGGAEVTSERAGGAPLWVKSEFLHAFLVTERLVTDRPVEVKLGAAQLTAGGLSYDHPAGKLELRGPMRAVWPPGGVQR